MFYNVEQQWSDLNPDARESETMSINTIFTPQDEPFYAVKTHAAGPQGALPLTPQMLLESPSGNLFGIKHGVENVLRNIAAEIHPEMQTKNSNAKR